MEGMAIFTGNSNPALAQKICDYLSQPLGGAKVKTFSDGEIQIEIQENVRLKDFIFRIWIIITISFTFYFCSLFPQLSSRIARNAVDSIMAIYFLQDPGLFV